MQDFRLEGGGGGEGGNAVTCASRGEVVVQTL